MKISIVISFFLVMQVAATGYSQNTKLDLIQNDKTIREVLRTIEQESNYLFFYNDDYAALNQVVNIKVNQKPINDVLDQLLTGTDVTYKLMPDNLIVLLPSSEKLRGSKQQYTITGTVRDFESNETLPGVNVVIDGTMQGTITDAEGRYSITVSGNSDVLTFSYVGYLTEKIACSGQPVIDVGLVPDIQKLEEVVVVGYGVQKKKLVTGATSQVKHDDFLKNRTTRLESSLQGLTSGISITQQSGQPGSDFNIIIRGMGSINGSNPLVLVDGVPGNLSRLNPQDVESIDILKDAASAAIYGSRAAGGVILITTKKGSEGKIKISIDSYYGISNAYRKLPMLNAREYAAIMNEAAINSGQIPYFTIDEINNLGAGTDWQEESYNKNAPTSNHYISLTGGNERSTYAVSLSYRKQEGIISIENKSFQENIGFHLNAQQNGFKWLRTGQNLTFNHTNSGSLEDGNQWVNTQRNLLVSSPLIPVYDPDQPDGYGRSTFSVNQINPIASMHYRNNSKSRFDYLISNMFVEIEPLKGLRFKTDFGVNLDISTFQSYSPIYDLSPNDKTTATAASQRMTRFFSYNWDNTLTYQKVINRHNLMVMVGQNAQDNRYFFVQGTKSDLIIGDFDHAVLNNATNLASAVVSGIAEPQDTRFSLFGRLSYSFADKYLINATLRRDGSSRFGPDTRFGYFPSVSAGWVISQENFMLDNVKWLEFLKLRASWGQNGREPFDRYIYLPTITNTERGYYFGPDESNAVFYNGASPERIPTPALKWEAATEANIGIDARFMHGFMLTADLYKRTSKDWIVQVPVKAITGINNPVPYINGGNVVNKGIELELGYVKHISKFTFEVKGNMAYNHNEVINIPNDEKVIHGSSSLFNTAAEVSRIQEGYPIGYFWGHKTAGIFQSQEEIESYVFTDGSLIQPDARPGDVRFVDKNHDGQIDDLDKTMLGKGMPDYLYGFSFTASYKGFSFAMNLQGQAGNQIVQCYRDPGIWYANYSTEILDRWTGPGTSDRIPRVTFGNEPNQNMFRVSDLYVHDADFLRIKSVNIGYDLKNLLFANKSMPEMFRIYFSGTNLFTFTKYNGLDPEVGFSGGYDNFSSGIDVGFYPNPRTYIVGVQINF